VSDKTEWDAARQRAAFIRKTILAATDKEGAIGRLLDMGYTEQEISDVIERMGHDRGQAPADQG